LPYLQACIKEGLRIYPPVTALLAKKVPAGGVSVDVDGVEKYIPADVQIAWNTWGLMRNPDIFGADYEIYRPERWLPRDRSEQEAARIARMTETVGLNFGYGRFGCLGRGVATMELNKAIIEMLLRYSLQPVSLKEPFREMVVGFYVHTDMNFAITKREEKGWKMPGIEKMEAHALPGAFEEDGES
jgi:cytochrome P450